MIPDWVLGPLLVLILGAIAGYLDYLNQEDLKKKIVKEIRIITKEVDK